MIKNPYIWIGLALVMSMLNCKNDKDRNVSNECITMVLKQDDSLGTVRNMACKTRSLSETIEDYANALSSIDFGKCPENFVDAFKEHEYAWRDMMEVTDKHEVLRGEMHELFDVIETGKDSTEFKMRLERIWDTWRSIEGIARPMP